MASKKKETEQFERRWVTVENAQEILEQLRRQDVSASEGSHRDPSGKVFVTVDDKGALVVSNVPVSDTEPTSLKYRKLPFTIAQRAARGRRFVEIVALHETFKKFARTTQAQSAEPASKPTDPEAATDAPPEPTYEVNPDDRERVEFPNSGWRSVCSLGAGIAIGAGLWASIGGSNGAANLTSWGYLGAFATLIVLLVLLDQGLRLIELAIWQVRAERDMTQLERQFERMTNSRPE